MDVKTGNELGVFLRSRREALTAAQVGLPFLGTRRARGLRREEVATLAGVSFDYLVRLEQGRDTNPSIAVLAALSEALKLSDEDKGLLLGMVARMHGPNLCPAKKDAAQRIRPGLQALLRGMGSTPAFVVGPMTDIMDWNESWSTFGEPLGFLAGSPPNLSRYVFMDPRAREVFAEEWGTVADDLVGFLRAAATSRASDKRFTTLLSDLRTAPEFGRRWHDPRGLLRSQLGNNWVIHAVGGTLRLTAEFLAVEDTGDRIVAWVPADEEADAATQPRRSAPLRVVGQS